VRDALGEAALRRESLRGIPVRVIGLSGEAFIDHGAVADLRRITRLDAEGIEGQIREELGRLGLSPAHAAPRPLEARTA
jgi:hypothetical protein